MSSDAHLGGSCGLLLLDDVPADRYDIYRHPRRIRLLDILDGDRRQSLSTLTTALLEREGVDVRNGEKRHEVRVSLVHNHLPRLAEYDVVDWDVETGAELAAEPPVCPSALSALVELDRDVDDLIDEVVDPVRLSALEVLAEDERAVSREHLAETLAARESAAPDAPGRVEIALHHSHLPALETAGLLEYDRDSGLVTCSADATPLYRNRR